MENQHNIPEHLLPRNQGTDRLFRNGLLEKLTRTHIAIPVTIHLIITGVVSWYGLQILHPLIFIPVFFTGWITWTFSEYWIHRYVYHVKTTKKWLLKIQHLGHGIHHQYPKDPTRLAMPPLPAILLASTFFLAFLGFMNVYAFAFFPGFLFGYVLYIGMHYAQHRFRPPGFGPLKRLWKYHAMHHYKYPETKAFGVSTILWDRVFRTLPSLEK